MISIPFVGSKKYSYKDIKPFVEQGSYDTVYEPFGGSCVLSVNLLNDGLVDRAVVNDYDRFFDNYETYLDLKDKVVEEGYKAGLRRSAHDSKGGYFLNSDGTKEYVKSFILQGEERKTIQNIIGEIVPEEYWRYFTLGNNFCHSGHSLNKNLKLTDFAMFNAYLKTDKQRGYLKVFNDCEINHLDYSEFISKYKDEIDENSLLIIDPPYVGTLQKQYEFEFSEEDTIKLIKTLQELPCDYIFFNRNKDKINEWFKDIDCVIEQTGIKRRRSPQHDTEEYLIYVKNRDTSNRGVFFNA